MGSTSSWGMVSWIAWPIPSWKSLARSMALRISVDLLTSKSWWERPLSLRLNYIIRGWTRYSAIIVLGSLKSCILVSNSIRHCIFSIMNYLFHWLLSRIKHKPMNNQSGIFLKLMRSPSHHWETTIYSIIHVVHSRVHTHRISLICFTWVSTQNLYNCQATRQS